MLRFTRPDELRIGALLEAQARERLTYPEVGGTRDGGFPAGYTYDRCSIALGAGVFDSARRGIREWRAHVGAGVSVVPPTAPIEPDTNVALTIRTGPLFAIAVCRIVYVCDDDHRFGFAYGTLPEHPEIGEEAFIVERDGADQVRFTITAFSRPGPAITRLPLAKPLARVVQRRVTRRYLEALRSYVVRSG